MNKLLYTAVLAAVSLLFCFSPANAQQDNDEDIYDQAYTMCADKAETVEGDYEATFEKCMKEKGFSEGEESHDGDETEDSDGQI